MSKYDKVSITQLRGLFVYDDDAGHLRLSADRHKGANRILVGRAGDLAGYPAARGYWNVTVDRDVFREHVAVWAMVTGEWPLSPLDHRDGDTGNNRFGNLRPYVGGQNRANGRPTQGRDLPRGVYRESHSAGYSVQIRKNGQLYQLGTFASVEEAAEVARRGHLAAHGEYSFFARAGGEPALAEADLRRLAEESRRPRRVLRGAAVGNSRLGDDDVRRIRAREHDHAELISELGISRSNYYRVRRRAAWAHVA